MKEVTDLDSKINELPAGYSEVKYKNKKYSLNKSVFNNGKSIKVYAEELGGNDFINFNFYITKSEKLLKPCEMPESKVVEFIEGIQKSNEL